MKSTQRIGLILALIFLLPALFFSVYEFSSLDKDEKMIQDIYGKQLEAILFSVNQYSDDIIGNWISRIENSVEDSLSDKKAIPKKINDLLTLNASIHAVFTIDTVNGQPIMKIFSLTEEDREDIKANVIQALQKEDSTERQLFSYKRSGFQKVQRIELGGKVKDFHCLIFVTQNDVSRLHLSGLLINAGLFIEDIVGPRLQTIARDQFILSAVQKEKDSVVYSTALTNTQSSDTTAEAVTKEFWIFPDYVLGIRTYGNTLQQIVRERTRINLMLLAGLDVILIIAVILVYRSLKKEVDLAQNKADFVSNVSHEIRTPLSLISMFAETLEMNRTPSENKKQEYYRIISKETQRLTGIVNKILNFSQTEAKKKTLHREKLNLKEEVNGVLATYDFHLSNKGFEYSLTGPDVRVMADREALIESVINLIDNAMKYTEDTKRIILSTGENAGFGFVSVRDFGLGISKKDQKNIFDKFYRVPKGNLARSRGTGLGLSLVKQLMESQKGKVSVESEPGHGSTFTLYFPVD